MDIFNYEYKTCYFLFHFQQDRKNEIAVRQTSMQQVSKMCFFLSRGVIIYLARRMNDHNKMRMAKILKLPNYEICLFDIVWKTLYH